MKKEKIQERIEKLRQTINHHRYLYHVLDKQEISDSALDSLKKELFDLEEKYPEFITPDSPTQRIGGEPLDKFEKVTHIEPMLSLNDAFTEEDVRDWIKRISKLIDEKEESEIDFFCELKIDGLAFELVYENGLLKTGSTRGDGRIGENVTENLKTIESIPLRLRESTDSRIIARGEIYVSKTEFQKINQNQKKLGLPLYANPRNVAAGSIRQLDSKITASRKLNIFAYDISGVNVKTHQEKHQRLKELGFRTCPFSRKCSNIEGVFKFYKKIIKERESLNYEIDGIVINVNNNELFNKLGVVGKAPRGAIAYKFPSKQTTTVIKDILIQVGRTGVLTPVAELKPVNLAGVKISRATLHNYDEIKRIGVKIGDTVIIERAGDVIPAVVKVLPELRTGKEREFKFPLKCPSCKTEVKKEKKGATIFRCLNQNCFSRKREYFSHFVSKKAFDFSGLGENIIDKFIKNNLISDAADLFLLKKEDIISLDGFAEKLAENIIFTIHNNKSINFSKFIFSLGIPNVGEETAHLLAEKFRDIEFLKKATIEELLAIKDIGEITAENIFNWFRQKENLLFLQKLKKVGVIIEEPKTKQKENLKGFTFVFTGTLPSLSREKAKEMIKSQGGRISESISSKTSFVVGGVNPGAKLEKAKSLKVKIINEDELLKML